MLNTIKENRKFFLNIFLYLLIPCYALSIIYSEGHHHPDEHYQILEFAKYKLKEITSDQLPWEFEKRVRPAIQPAIAYGIIKMTRFFSFNDETATLFLRLLSGVLGLFCFLLLLIQNFPTVHNQKLACLLILFCLTLWFTPFCHVRFSSENWSGIFFWLGFYLIHKDRERNKNLNRIVSSIIAGVLLGLSFQFRYQMGFCILGLFLWVWVVKNKWRINTGIIILSLSMLSVIVLVTYYIDTWFYSEYVIPAYHYFYQNIIVGKSAQFGLKTSWIDYFTKGAEAFILPFGVFFLPLIILFFYFKPKHPFTWIIGPFILIHLVMSNNQLRFMFSLVYVFPIMISYSIHILSVRYQEKFEHIFHKKWMRMSILIYFAVSIVILINRSTYTNQLRFINMHYLKEDMKKRFPNQKSYLISISSDILYGGEGLLMSFYKPENLEEIYLAGEENTTNAFKQQINQFKKQNIDTFYLNLYHTRFYRDKPPFPENLSFVEKNCQYLFNALDNHRIKYNIYRLVRQIGHMHSIYLCKV